VFSTEPRTNRAFKLHPGFELFLIHNKCIAEAEGMHAGPSNLMLPLMTKEKLLPDVEKLCNSMNG
jgi:hypothetical protein